MRNRVTTLVLTVESELDPAGTARREATARRGRRISIRPEPDGMASLWALLPAAQLRAFTVGLDELHARQLLADRRAGIDRTADQRRADLLALLPALALHALAGTTPIFTPDGGCGHPAVVLNVHVPVATVLGWSEHPGHLDGYGPISAEHTRLLLPTAHLRRILTDQHTGQPLHADTHLHGPHPDPAAPAAAAAAARAEDTAGPAEDTTGPGDTNEDHTPADRRAADDTAGQTAEPAAATATTSATEMGRPTEPGSPAETTGLAGTTSLAGTAGPAGQVTTPAAAWPKTNPASEPTTRTDPNPTGAPQPAPASPTPASQAPAPQPAPSADPTAAPARNRLLEMLPDQPIILHDTPEPHYRPSAALARLIRLRDPLCTAPGCATTSTRSDLDHDQPWPHGRTAAYNLHPKSRRCHRAKTLSWTATHHSDGSHTWTSPTGRSYPVPAHWQPAPTPQPPRPAPPVQQAQPAPGHRPARSTTTLTAILDHTPPPTPPTPGPKPSGWDDDPGF